MFSFWGGNVFLRVRERKGLMDDKEYQEIKRRWGHKHSEINKLIAYCEELRVISTISETQISNLATLGERLEEENAGLKEEFTDYQKWARNCCDLLEVENARLKEELNEAGLNW